MTAERTRLLLAVMIGVMATTAILVLVVVLTRTRNSQGSALASPQPPPPTAATTLIPPVEAPTTELISAPSPTTVDVPTEVATNTNQPPPPTASPTEIQAEAPPTTPTPTLANPDSLPPLTGPQELTGEGSNPTGPINLEAGLYRLTVETDEAFSAVGPEVIEGDCGEIPFFTNESGPFEGSATYRSTGCRVRFEVSGTSGGWSITVEPAAEGGLLAVPITFSGDSPSTTGLVDLPEGDYHLTLVTESQFSMVVPVVASGECLERPVFLLTEPGTHQTTYRSTGCQIVFQIDSVTAAWELAITTKE